MKKVTVGGLKKRVTILKQVRVSDGQGGFNETWQEAGTVWAAIEPVSGREYYEAMQLSNDVTHRVRMRYMNLTPHERIKYGYKVFDIVAVIDVNMEHRELEVLCRERT